MRFDVMRSAIEYVYAYGFDSVGSVITGFGSGWCGLKLRVRRDIQVCVACGEDEEGGGKRGWSPILLIS